MVTFLASTPSQNVKPNICVKFVQRWLRFRVGVWVPAAIRLHSVFGVCWQSRNSDEGESMFRIQCDFGVGLVIEFRGERYPLGSEKGCGRNTWCEELRLARLPIAVLFLGGGWGFMGTKARVLGAKGGGIRGIPLPRRFFGIHGHKK